MLAFCVGSEATKKTAQMQSLKNNYYIESFWGESTREGLFSKSSSLANTCY
jgi:hypothetical protein